jgi:hypothetical protein
VFVASVIEHAKRIGRIILSSMPCSALQYFSTLFRKRNDFRGKVIEYKKVFCFSLQPLSEILLIIRIIERYVTNVHRSSCKGPVILFRF